MNFTGIDTHIAVRPETPPVVQALDDHRHGDKRGAEQGDHDEPTFKDEGDHVAMYEGNDAIPHSIPL